MRTYPDIGLVIADLLQVACFWLCRKPSDTRLCIFSVLPQTVIEDTRLTLHQLVLHLEYLQLTKIKFLNLTSHLP